MECGLNVLVECFGLNVLVECFGLNVLVECFGLNVLVEYSTVFTTKSVLLGAPPRSQLPRVRCFAR